MLTGIAGFLLVQSVAIGIGYKRGKVQGMLSTGKHLKEATDKKFFKHKGK